MFRRLCGSKPVILEASAYLSPQRATPSRTQSPINQLLTRPSAPRRRPAMTHVGLSMPSGARHAAAETRRRSWPACAASELAGVSSDGTGMTRIFSHATPPVFCSSAPNRPTVTPKMRPCAHLSRSLAFVSKRGSIVVPELIQAQRELNLRVAAVQRGVDQQLDPAQVTFDRVPIGAQGFAGFGLVAP
jgi:hypothetical protein